MLGNNEKGKKLDDRQLFEELVRIGMPILQKAKTLLIDFDIEADGIPGMGSLLQIGAISPFGQTFKAELKPASELYLPANRAFCEKYNLSRERLLQEGEDPAEVMQRFYDWTQQQLRESGKKKAVLVAFNASFDFPWVDLEFKRAGIKHPFGVAGFCVKSLAMALTKDYNWADTAKSRLAPELSPADEFTHDALEDAIYQQKQHAAIVGALAKRGLLGHLIDV